MTMMECRFSGRIYSCNSVKTISPKKQPNITPNIIDKITFNHTGLVSKISFMEQNCFKNIL